MLSAEVDGLQLRLIEEPTRRLIVDPGVLPPAAPERLHDLDRLVRALVALFATGDRLAVVRRDELIARRHGVPPRAAVAHDVESLELAGRIERLLECR